MTASATLRTSLAGLALAGAVALSGCQPQESLTGQSWIWTGVQGTGSGATTVPPGEPAYTVEFATNGSVAVKTACADASGTYRVSIPLDLTVEVTTSIPDCAAAPLTGQFIEFLGQVGSYSTDGGQLKLFFGNQTGAMQFKKGVQ